MAGEEPEWFYVDSTGQEFGPFPSSTMRGWFQQGFFPMQGDLLVRLSSWSDHQKLGTLYGEPITETAFDGPPRGAQSKPAPKSGGGKKQGGRGRGGGGGGGNVGGDDLQMPQMGGYDPMMGGLNPFMGGAMGLGAMMPGAAAMQGAGLAAYGFPSVRPGGYSPMSPFGGMPMMPGPGATTGRFHGRIKSFNAQKGFGFIECPEAHAIYGRDVFLHKAQIGDFNTGSELSFSVEMNKQNMPQARDLAEVDPFAAAMGMGGLMGMGMGGLGMGGRGAGGGNKGGGRGKGGAKAKAKPKGKATPKKAETPA